MKTFSETLSHPELLSNKSLFESESQKIAENIQNYIMSDKFMVSDDKISELKQYIGDITPFKVGSGENELIVQNIQKQYKQRFVNVIPQGKQPNKKEGFFSTIVNKFKGKDPNEMTVKEILDKLNI
jgi:hypothetical protein